MVMRRARPLSLRRCRSITTAANASAKRARCLRSGAFSKRDRVGCEARSAPAIGSRPTSSLCTGSAASRAASLASSYPQAMAITRGVNSSCNACSTLPVWRRSSRHAAKARVSPSRRSAAFSKMAPPSELPCRWSNCITTGGAQRSENSEHCVVVSSAKRKPPLWPQTASQQRVCTTGGFSCL